MTSPEFSLVTERLRLPNPAGDFIDRVRGRKIVAFGAGSLGRKTMARLRSTGHPIDSVVDNDPKKWGTEFEGIRISSPTDLALQKPRPIVIVASHHAEEILRSLEASGITAVLADFVLDHFHSPSGLVENLERIETLFSLLGDEPSRHVLATLISLRLDRERFAQTSGLYTREKYFPADLFRPSSDEVFVDGGAWEGDTILDFTRWTGGSFKKAYAFEASPPTFERLKASLLANRIDDRVEPVHACLFGGSGILSFAEYAGPGLSAASRIVDPRIPLFGAADRSHSVPSRALDEFLEGRPVSFIKMDIEGAEIAALSGAKETITRCKPKLAICTYHRDSDLWEIPLLLKSLVPEYRIFVRHHARHSTLETVCYATL